MLPFKAVVTVAVLVLSSATVFAQPPTWSLSIDFLSRYVGGPNMAPVHGKPVVQTGITASFGACSVNIWGSASLGESRPAFNGGNEIDMTGTCSRKFGEYELSGGVAYFDLSAPHLLESRGDIVQVFAELSRTFTYGSHMLSPYVRVEPSFVTRNAGADGVYTHIGLRHAFRISDLLSWQNMGRLVYDTGVYGLEAGVNARVDTALAWSITDKLTLRLPVLRAFVPVGGSFDDGRKSAFVYGAGIDVKF